MTILPSSFALGDGDLEPETLTDQDSYVIPNTRVVNLPSASNGVSYQLYIHVPPACSGEGQRCPAVYMLDAEYSFGLASHIVTHLSDRNRIPPLVSVAIGYQDKSHYREFRTRDYTPFFFPTGGYGADTQKVSGGGPAFLEVIEKDIIPFVELNFPVSPAPRTLVGHSYGGLFATYVWQTKPGLFRNYVIVSPSLWYADGQPIADIRRTCDDAGQEPKTSIFLAVGTFEEQPQIGRAMVSDFKKMVNLLRGCSTRSVAVDSRIFDDETHASIFPAALSTGLRSHF